MLRSLFNFSPRHPRFLFPRNVPLGYTPLDKIAENPMPGACTRMHISLFLVGLHAASLLRPPHGHTTTQPARPTASWLPHSLQKGIGCSHIFASSEEKSPSLLACCTTWWEICFDARMDARLHRPKQPCNCNCNKRSPLSCLTYAHTQMDILFCFWKEKYSMSAKFDIYSRMQFFSSYI